MILYWKEKEKHILTVHQSDSAMSFLLSEVATAL